MQETLIFIIASIAVALIAGFMVGHVVAIRPDTPPNPHFEVTGAQLISMSPKELDERRRMFRDLRVSLRRAERQLAAYSDDSVMGDVLQDMIEDRKAGVK